MAGVLKVCTADGIDIYVLPDCAKCTLTGKSPLDMDKCPALNFDDYGDVCCPVECDYYTVRYSERKKDG